MEKCLSVRQPYAYWLARGYYEALVFPRNTKYRGKVLIYAPLRQVEVESYESIMDDDLFEDVRKLVIGAIVGSAELERVKQVKKTCYYWFFKNTELFQKPIPIRGESWFFSISSGLLSNRPLIRYVAITIKGKKFYRPEYVSK